MLSVKMTHMFYYKDYFDLYTVYKNITIIIKSLVENTQLNSISLSKFYLKIGKIGLIF